VGRKQNNWPDSRRVAGLAEKTVGHHVQRIYDKVGVSTRAEAALYAVQNELL
jgi:DNA-binding NarL/FixJ family response regulator